MEQFSKILVNDLRRYDKEGQLLSERLSKLSKIYDDSSEVYDDEQKNLCMYCGKSEGDICSSFVVGQNIFEFMLDKVVFPLLPSLSLEMLKSEEYRISCSARTLCT